MAGKNHPTHSRERLFSLGLHGAHQAYRSGGATPSEVVEKTLAHLSEVEPVLNAFAWVDIAGARAAAAASSKRWKNQAPLGLLDGAVVTIKDNLAVANLPCAWGSELFSGLVPEQDELPVARLRAAGAIILGKTNVSEFTLGKSTVSTKLFGTTRNPWNAKLTTGASSGGAAAAVAAGLGSIGLATDGGGSIRRPASHCGLVGLKPGVGRVARLHGLPLILGECESVGVLGRTVEDVAIAYEAIAIPHAADKLTWPYMDLAARRIPKRRLRIKYIPKLGNYPVDAEVAVACEQVAERFRDLGFEVEVGEFPFDIEATDRAWSIFSASGLAWALRKYEWDGKISDFHADLARKGAEIKAADYVQSTVTFRELAGQVGEIFRHVDLVMTPAAGALPWSAELDGPAHERVFTRFANIAGVPAIAVPAEPHQGIPIGFQLVAPFNGEGLLLSTAKRYQAYYPWAQRWPHV